MTANTMIDELDLLTPAPLRELRMLKKATEAAKAQMPGPSWVPTPSVQPLGTTDMVSALPRSTAAAVPPTASPSLGPDLSRLTAGVGSMLPRSTGSASTGQARPNSGSFAAPPVAANVPEQASAAGELAGIDKRRQDLQDRLTRIEDAAPDYSAAQAYARQRGEQGMEQLGAAVLAGVGPSFAQRLQPQLMAQYTASQKPLQMEGAVISPDGQVIQDPQFKRMQTIQNLSRRIADLDQMEQRTLDRQSREEIAREKLQNQLLLRQMINAAKGGGGGPANEFGGPSVVIGKDAEGNDIFRHTKSSRLFQYDPSGQAQAFGGGVFEKRDLPKGTVDDLQKWGGQYTSFADLEGTWHQGLERQAVGLGKLQDWWGANMPNAVTPEQWQARSNWFSAWQKMANEMRHGLFGAALTKPELESFNRATITPDMKASEIATRLAQQRVAAAQAVEKLRAAYGKNYQTHKVLPQSVNLVGPAPGETIQARPDPNKGQQRALPNASGAAYERKYGGGL